MSNENSFLRIGCRTKIFSIGIIVGCFGGLVWQELLAPLEISPRMDREVEVQLLKEDASEKLLQYIEGKWTSSIGDLVINLEDSKVRGNLTVIENADDKTPSTKHFRIADIETVDGFFGIVKLKICEANKECTEKDMLPIQINKVFGINDTITISFDKRLAFCIQPELLCTRAFKRTE